MRDTQSPIKRSSRDSGVPVKDVADRKRTAGNAKQVAERHIQIESEIEITSSEEEVIDTFINRARASAELDKDDLMKVEISLCYWYSGLDNRLVEFDKSAKD